MEYSIWNREGGTDTIYSLKVNPKVPFTVFPFFFFNKSCLQINKLPLVKFIPIGDLQRGILSQKTIHFYERYCPRFHHCNGWIKECKLKTSFKFIWRKVQLLIFIITWSSGNHVWSVYLFDWTCLAHTVYQFVL